MASSLVQVEAMLGGVGIRGISVAARFVADLFPVAGRRQHALTMQA
jgi:hypothetical protein